MIDLTSIHLLERAVTQAGIDPRSLWSQPQDWSTFPEQLNPWIAASARHLARDTLIVCAVVDFEAVLIDGAFPGSVRADLVRATRAALAKLDTRGLTVPGIEPGTVGQNARAIGAATTPVFARYLLNTHVGIAMV